MNATDTAKPQTVAELVKDAVKEDKNMRLFIVYSNGLGSKIVAAGRTHDEMWTNAIRDLGLGRRELIHRNHVFDVVTAKEAAELIGNQ